MPVSVVIGGQFGSEGKGKTALEIVRRNSTPVIVIRVGGPNSGHTAYARCGERYVLRQLPAACVDGNVDVVLPAGAYIDVDVLEAEIDELDYPRERIRISEQAEDCFKRAPRMGKGSEIGGENRVNGVGCWRSGIGICSAWRVEYWHESTNGGRGVPLEEVC